MSIGTTKWAIGCLALLGLTDATGAAGSLEGRVRLPSGAAVPGAQVRLFELSEFRLLSSAATDEVGRFALSLEGLAAPSALPERFSIGPNYPNPFNPSTLIPYQLPSPAPVRLEVFNLLGQRIATLVEEVQPAGFHHARWDGTDAGGRAVGAGVYLYRLQSGPRVATGRMVLVDGQAGIPAPQGMPSGTPPGAEASAVGTAVYGLTVTGPGLAPYVDPAFRVETGMVPVDLVVEEAGLAPREKAASNGVPGDVDNNGRVDIVDALLVATYIADNSVTMPNNGDISQADMNRDGQIDYIDVWLIVTQFVLQQIGEQDEPDRDSRMYWTDSISDKIQRANLDGSNVEDLVTTGLRAPSDIALDLTEGKMYWMDQETDKIQRSNLDGSNVEDLITTLDYPSGLALDLTAGKMYWTDLNTDKIQRSNLDGSNIEDLVTRGLITPRGLALDIARGKMYWADHGTDKIQRANLDGSDVQDLVATGLAVPDKLALDLEGGKIYWTESGLGKIQRADLDGSKVEDLVTELGQPRGIALDLDGGRMYWTEIEPDRIQSADLDGSNVEGLVTTGLGGPTALALAISMPGEAAPASATLSPDPSSVDILDDGAWHAFTVQASESVVVVANPTGSTPRAEITGSGGDSNRCPAVARDSVTRSDGQTLYLSGCEAGPAKVELRKASDQTLLRTYTFTIEEVPAATTGPGTATIYWTTGDKIQRADPDGANVEDIVAFGSPRSLAVDVVEGHVYWTDQGSRWIWRANLDGSETAAVVNSGLIRPVALSLDRDRGHIYWTDAGSNRIQRADLDGSRVQTLVSVGLHSPEGLALDVAGGKIYWSDYGTNKIQRADLDGSNVEDLISTGLKIPGDLALDTGAGKIYWTDYGTDKIQRADLDGSDVEDLVTTGLSIAKGLALDLASGKIYWADAGTRKIGRADLDGSNVETLLTRSTGSPTGLALANPFASLTPNPASVALHRSGTWRRFEVQATEPVVVVANPTGSPPRILIAPSGEDAGPCPAQAEASLTRYHGQSVYLAACEPGEARVELRRVSDWVSDQAVLRTYTFRISEKARMYWTNSGSRDEIQRANLDGSNVQDLVTAGLVHLIDIALDLTEGKMYWTDHGTDKIQRANLDGSQVEDLIITGLRYPVGLALDLTAGQMYWTDMELDRIRRANLDGSNLEDLVTSGLTTPRGLALDVSRGKMYWVDQGTDKIQRANLDGSDVQDLVTTGLNDPDRLALDVDGNRMYWTDAMAGKIQRADLDGSNVEDLVTALGTPRGMALDLDGGRMYWTDSGTRKIQSADLDGSDIKDLVTGLDIPTAITLE
ncbi:MAG: DUF5050 domain-containing protein [Gemmatimonadaceae bacterium]|nr:DUF5050 domain-containing protein [Gemmatimonadaceae bacterium]